MDSRTKCAIALAIAAVACGSVLLLAAAAMPLWFSLALLVTTATAGFVLLMLAWERWKDDAVARLGVAVGIVILAAGFIEVAAWVVFERSFREAPRAIQRTFTSVAGLSRSYAGAVADESDGVPGSGRNFAPHPFLNFALNPSAAYMGWPQTNGDYLIRRREAIRPRADVSWRALAIGGSTTFGEFTADERDTWVYRLEQKLRDLMGGNVDVINGGVGGYAVVDNLIHYALLLRNLRPDLVILFVGINDVHPRLVGEARPDYSNIRKRRCPALC